LMNLLTKNGRMIEPVTIWFPGMQIINGFHRTEAAKRLKWTEIPCLVQELTEDEFWDARIIAARPHYKVQPARMAIWISESWKQTPWYIPNPNNDDWSLIESVWEVFGKGKAAFALHPTFSNAKQKDIYDWLNEKANRWGMGNYDVVRHLLNGPLGGTFLMLRGEMMDGIAASHNLTLAQRIDLQNALNSSGRVVRSLDWCQVEEWVKNDYLQGGRSIAQFAQETEAERRQRQKDEAERTMLEALRKRQFAQSAQGQAKLESDRAKTQSERLRSVLSNAKQNLELLKNEVESAPEAPAMLAAFAQFVVDFSEQHFPGIEIAKPNPVSLENASIRAENARLKERIASLERALGSRESAGGMIAKAVAWSSTDLDN